MKSLVDAIGGTISVKSQLGKGTEFKIELYVAAADVSADEAAPADSGQDLHGAHVLLVEDNEINTYVAKTILEDFSCEVDTAGDGRL